MAKDYRFYDKDEDSDYSEILGPLLVFAGISSVAAIINAISCYPEESDIKLMGFVACVVLSSVTLLFVLLGLIDFMRSRKRRSTKSRSRFRINFR